MKKIEAYEAPDGTLFKTKKAYETYVALIESKRKADLARQVKEKAEQKLREKQLEEANYPRNNATSIEHFLDLCKEYFDKYFPELEVQIEWGTKHFTEKLGNTHSCPIDGVTNWGGRKEGAPRSYPGYQLGIKYFWRVQGGVGLSNLQPFNGEGRVPGMNLGTGNYCGDLENEGLYGMSQQVNLYIQDFPLIQVAYDEYKQMTEVRSEVTSLREDSVDVLLAKDSKHKELFRQAQEINEKISLLQSSKKDLYEKMAEIRWEARNKIEKDIPFDEEKYNNLKNMFQ